MVSDDRAEAAIGRLVAERVLTRDQADAVLAALAVERAAAVARGKVLAEIASYVGAGLLFGGIALVASSSWDALDRPVRVGVLAVVSAGLLLGGVLLARVPTGRASANSARARLAAVLFALGSVALAGSVGTALEHASTDAAWVFACTAGAVIAVLGYLALPTVIGMLVCACFLPAAVAGSATEVFGLDDSWGSVAVLVLGGMWFALTRVGALIDVRVGYLIAIVTSVAAAQTLDVDGRIWAYGITALIAVVCFALYATQRSAVLVVGGGVAIAVAAGEAVSDWTGDSLGAAAVVVAIGAITLALGAFRLARPRREKEADPAVPVPKP
ncbi:DUF2157 domain-containing protein [Nocardia beijingensis]|uniref:DUF2157 domain-containing protein n=1 Tax=Nocardia beijingensis TaxID=95162 RepID=UPI001892D408|nr:DUF2157 domain-containing protein [Nocardia beijingensis]MBF6467868.1 DUF2157 domain-containing protein [Nocardia beijingensis]